MRKNLNQCLEPADEIARDYLKNIAVGETYRVEIRKPRNIQFHRKFMALIKIAWENQDKYDAFTTVRKEIIMRAGFYTEHHHLTGKISYEAKSIAFANMDELEFADLYSKSIDVILQYFMPDTDAESLNQAVEEVIGFAG